MAQLDQQFVARPDAPRAHGAAYEVQVLRDLPYVAADPAPEQRLDLYLPQGAAGFPVIVSLHGGGLIEGDKRGDEPIARRLAGAGIGVAVANYRLSPGASHPAHVEDAAAAFAWTKQSVAQHGGNADRLFVIGHSAGAYLAALLATDARYLAAHGLAAKDIAGLIPVSGFFWVEQVAPDRPKHIWGESRAQWLEASPARHLRGGLPPTLFVYADGDDPARRQQHIDFVQVARAGGNADVELLEIAGRDHRSLWTRIAEPGDELLQLIVSFVRASSPVSSKPRR
jgi:acetyl esterase/lipase